MKRNILTLLFCMVVGGLYAQTMERNIYSITNGTVQSSPEFVGKLYNEDTEITPFILKNGTTAIVNNQAFSVRLSMYNGYDKDPGDFEIIQIFNNKNESIFELRNELGWIKIPSVIDATTPYLLIGVVDAYTKALITIGYPYESTPGWLTIILLRENSAKLVFNKHYVVEKFTKTDTSFKLYIADSCDDEAEGAKVNHCIIYSQDGILKMKQISYR